MRLPPPRATIGLVCVTVAAWGLVAYAGQKEPAALAAGFVPASWLGAAIPGALPGWITPLTATLVHAGLLHITFNMLMLGFCGRFVEAAIGPGGLIALYIGGAYAAAGAQFLPDPSSFVPMVGASGAGSAVLGAYAILYGNRRARSGKPRLNRLLHAVQLAVAWVVLQLLVHFASPGMADGNAIAVAAHIGGFIAGLALAHPLLLWRHRHA